MKYKVIASETASRAFERLLGNECLYHHFFGHSMSRNERRKVAYIWKAIIKQTTPPGIIKTK